MEQKQASDNAVTTGSGRKKGKKLIIVFILLIVAVAVAVYFGIMYLNKPSEQQTSAPKMTDFASSAVILSGVKAELKGQEQNIDVATGLGGVTKDGYGLYGIAPYKVGDRLFENLPAESTGVAYASNSEQAAVNYDSIIDFFVSHHVKLVTSGKDTAGTISGNDETVQYVSYAVYETNKQLCMAWHADASGTALGAHIASLGCAEKTSYSDAAKALDDFFAAYSKSVQAPYDGLVLGSPVTGKGEAGYEHAVVHQESGEQFEGLYYREKDATDWVYFLGVQGVAPCSEFTSDAARKAFSDFECLGDAGKSERVE